VLIAGEVDGEGTCGKWRAHLPHGGPRLGYPVFPKSVEGIPTHPECDVSKEFAEGRLDVVA
jgi:hypothetical protein